jgi:predicted PhzF superfamily epimerase YddE/YHI9
MQKYSLNVFSENPQLSNHCVVYLVSIKLQTEAMQKIAISSNLSESVFVEEKPHYFSCRIFSPKQEMTSCTHAMLAASYVHSKKLNNKNKPILFQGKPLSYDVNGNRIVLSIARLEAKNIDVNLGNQYSHPIFESAKQWAARTSSGYKRLMLEFASLKDVMALSSSSLAEVDQLIPDVESYFVYCSLDNSGNEFYGRMFAPKLGIGEDPVNGNSCIALFSLQRIKRPDVPKITFVQNKGAKFTIEEKLGELFLSANCFESN